MASDNSADLIPKTSKFRDIASIMKDPKLRAKLSNLVDEAVSAKEKIARQNDIIKALREAALKDLELSPKLFNAYVSAASNNDYGQRKDALAEQVTLLELVMNEAQIGFSPSSNDD